MYLLPEKVKTEIMDSIRQEILRSVAQKLASDAGFEGIAAQHFYNGFFKADIKRANPKSDNCLDAFKKGKAAHTKEIDHEIESQVRQQSELEIKEQMFPKLNNVRQHAGYYATRGYIAEIMWNDDDQLWFAYWNYEDGNRLDEKLIGTFKSVDDMIDAIRDRRDSVKVSNKD